MRKRCQRTQFRTKFAGETPALLKTSRVEVPATTIPAIRLHFRHTPPRCSFIHEERGISLQDAPAEPFFRTGSLGRMTHSEFIWAATSATFLAVVVISILGLHLAGAVTRLWRQNDARLVDRRSSDRRAVSLPVFVYGHRGDEEPFFEDAMVQQVSAHGALLTLTAPVRIGQQLLLARNGDQELHRACHVARLGSSNGPGTEIAIKFAEPAPEFWADDSLLLIEAVPSRT